MTPNDLAPKALGRQCRRLLDHLGGIVGVVCHGDDDAATDEMEAVLSRRRGFVFGNRKTTPVNYADLKYMLASDLRVLLAELEK